MSEDLVFRSRALAQAHPFSAAGFRYMRFIVDRERESQPRPELGEWAGHALTTGYCLRKVEEVEVTGTPLAITDIDDLEAFDHQAGQVATTLRTEGLKEDALFPEATLVGALDRLIAGEIDRRLDQWRGTVDEAQWRQMEDYLAHWLIKGYAARIVEARVGT